MTTIGIAESGPLKIFINRPQYYSDIEIEYFEALETDKMNLKVWESAVDEHADQDFIDEKWDAYQSFNKRVISLKRQLKCDHKMGTLFSGGGFIENEICEVCGVLRTKTIKQHKSAMRIG